METSFVPVFFLCLAILAVLRTSWISSRADRRARRAVRWIRSNHPDTWERHGGWPVQLNLWPRATLAVLIRELDASDPKLRRYLEPVRQLRHRFWFSFAVGVASVTTLVMWIKGY
jgi:hypothetical protein